MTAEVTDATPTFSLVVPFSIIPAQQVSWLWPGLIPMRHVTLLVAPGKTSKGLVTIDLAARMTTGKPMPGETEEREPMNVILIAPEDDANEAVRQRLDAAGADVSKVFNLTTFADGTKFRLPDNMADLRVAVDEIERNTGIRVGMVIIDPLFGTVTKSLNTNLAARAVTEPLEAFAKQPMEYDPLDPDDPDKVHPGLAVVLTQHTTKAGKTASSQGLTDSVRVVLRLARTNPKVADDPRRFLSIEVTNLPTDAGRVERYTIQGNELESSIVWQADQPKTAGQNGHYGYKVATPIGPATPVVKAPAKPDSVTITPLNFRVRQRTEKTGQATVTKDLSDGVESLAAGFAVASKANGATLGFKQLKTADGRTVWTAKRTVAKGHVVTYAVWDTTQVPNAVTA